MKTVKVTGKTIEEALNQALKQLNTDLDNVEYTVLEEPSKGFLGLIGAKPALLEVTLKEEEEQLQMLEENRSQEEDEERTELEVDPSEEAHSFLLRVIEEMKVDVEVSVRETEEELQFHLSGKDIGVMIGKRGRTLDSLQYLVHLVRNRSGHSYKRVVIDAENYRKKRQETLERLAERLAHKAVRTGEKVVLEPMNARDRKIIHTALQDREDVETYSEGTGSRRHVVIRPM